MAFRGLNPEQHSADTPLVRSEHFLVGRMFYILCAKSLRRVQLFLTPWTVARQAPLSMGFSSKNTGVGCHALLQGVFPTQGWNPRSLTSPALTGRFSTSSATWEAPFYILDWKQVLEVTMITHLITPVT